MLYSSLNEDDVIGTRFIDKDHILDLVTEEDIFRLVFGFPPKEFEYVSSPFREDNSPGAYFHYSPSGKLFFVDFGDPKRSHYDCFNAVQEKFGLNNLFETLLFIRNHFTNNPQEVLVAPKRKTERAYNRKELFVTPRDFNLGDKTYWQQYGITKQQLVDDKVFPISSFKFISKNYSSKTTKCFKPSYAYTGFEGRRKKLYRPFAKKKFRFLSTCRTNDIGEIDSLIPFGRQLVISKSYKDCRVIRNFGLNSVWLQSEGTKPSLDLLIPLCKRFNSVIVFYDNDEAGLQTAKVMSELINEHVPGLSRPFSLPLSLGKSIKDPADMYRKHGRQALGSLLNQGRILL
jgi:hypothetical protein